MQTLLNDMRKKQKMCLHNTGNELQQLGRVIQTRLEDVDFVVSHFLHWKKCSLMEEERKQNISLHMAWVL